VNVAAAERLAVSIRGTGADTGFLAWARLDSTVHWRRALSVFAGGTLVAAVVLLVASAVGGPIAPVQFAGIAVGAGLGVAVATHLTDRRDAQSRERQ
jgi:hypothetical protein